MDSLRDDDDDDDEENASKAAREDEDSFYSDANSSESEADLKGSSSSPTADPPGVDEGVEEVGRGRRPRSDRVANYWRLPSLHFSWRISTGGGGKSWRRKIRRKGNRGEGSDDDEDDEINNNDDDGRNGNDDFNLAGEWMMIDKDNGRFSSFGQSGYI